AIAGTEAAGTTGTRASARRTPAPCHWPSPRLAPPRAMEPRLNSGRLGAGRRHRRLRRAAIGPRAPEGRCVVTEAEREVADLLPIEVDPDVARVTAEQVPFWFHTFA